MSTPPKSAVSGSQSAPQAGKTPPCPTCRKPGVPAHAPFCSAVCRDRDLIAWLDERHVIPGKNFADDEEFS